METRFLTFFLYVALSLMLVSCQPSSERLVVTRTTIPVFGTLTEVQIRHPKGEPPTEAVQALEQLFQRLHKDWHPWEPGALTELNKRLMLGDWTTIPNDLYVLLATSQRMEMLSEGAFNAAIGQLVSLWGFHTSEYPITEPPPSPEAISKLVNKTPSTLGILHRENARGETEIMTPEVGLRLDFSGIAKGGAAQLACDLLNEYGLGDALVNLGGDVMICGKAAKPWRVAIKDPRAGVLEIIEVSEPMAVFTSGQYYRWGEWQGERYAHVLNPKTGYPIEHVLQATAIHADPLIADAAATALVVAGPMRASALGQTLGLSQWGLVDDEGNIRWSDF